MKTPSGQLIIAGDAIYAGTDLDDICRLENALVVQFKEKLAYAKALKSKQIDLIDDEEKFCSAKPILDNEDAEIIGIPIATSITVKVLSVKSPCCESEVSGFWLGDPRGKVVQCSVCEKDFEVAGLAEFEFD